MAGRPKRAEAVTPVLLRIPPALLARVNRCKAQLELQGDISLSRTEVFWRLLELGCGVLEAQMSGLEPKQTTPTPPAPMAPSHLATVDEAEPMAAPALPMAVPQAPEPDHPASMADVERTTETPSRRSQRGLPREKLEEIADEWTRCQGLSLREFAQRLYDKGIYRAKGDKPAEAGWLSRLLAKAQVEGVL
jgi:hypothetical protein